MKVDFEILLHDCCAKQKQHRISSWGLGSWDPAAKEHKTLQRYATRNQFSRRGYEDLDPHENSYESSLHFRISNKQRAA